MNATNSVILVIPCYNEAARLNVPAFMEFLEQNPTVSYLFVNDGSTDETSQVINDLSAKSERVNALHLEKNSGKAEAVRIGMLDCSEKEFGFAGYWDADLSTPLEELPHFISMMNQSGDTHIVTGARIKLIGRHIERKRMRHYTGRAFATAVSLLFGIQMYDTQCGAKLFRVGPDIASIFKEPFLTRWVFDVELFVRYSLTSEIESKLVELPLMQWRDVADSKMRVGDFLKAPLELLRIYFAYR